MTYCKQGEIWLEDETRYIVLSDDRYNRRMGRSICMELVDNVGYNSDLYVPVFSRRIQCDLWANMSTICSMERLTERVCRVSNMAQVREILHNFSRLFGSMCYMPVFGYSIEEYKREERAPTPPPPKVKKDDGGGWIKVKGRRKI